MKHKALLLCAAIGLLAAAGPSAWAEVDRNVHIAPKIDRPDIRPPRPPDPEAIAKRCVNAVHKIAKKCSHANEHTARFCVKIINHLQEHGYHEAAKRLAEACKERITRRSNACVDSINRLCRHCVAVLQRLNARPELVRRVVHNCEVARKAVRTSQEETIKKINAAVRDGNDSGGNTITDGA